jgi:predicted NAD/FAD-binding protein
MSAWSGRRLLTERRVRAPHAKDGRSLALRLTRADDHVNYQVAIRWLSGGYHVTIMWCQVAIPARRFTDMEVEIIRVYRTQDLEEPVSAFGVELVESWLAERRFCSAFIRARRPI